MSRSVDFASCCFFNKKIKNRIWAGTTYTCERYDRSLLQRTQRLAIVDKVIVHPLLNATIDPSSLAVHISGSQYVHMFRLLSERVDHGKPNRHDRGLNLCLRHA